MRIQKQDFSIQEIAKEKGLAPLQHDKRSVRLEESDGQYTIYTNQKGRDWNPLKGYFDKRLLVKKLEKQIDDVLGKKGEGKKLTKAVGAYNRSFMTKWLPKMNMEQIEQLKSIVDARTALKDFDKQIGTDARPIFSKRFELNQAQRETVEADLKKTF